MSETTDRDSAAPPCWTPSIGARMWVQAATDMGKLIDLLPEDDRQMTIELLPILWSSDPDEVSAAQHTLYEIIDNPPGHLVEL